MTEICTIVMPTFLKDKAKKMGINVSEVCREALAGEIVRKSELEKGGKQNDD